MDIKGEIGFFDFYIIPLTKKLKDCGVFGISSDEYLNYALKNRAEWEKKGAAATAEMVANAREKEYAKLEKMAAARAPLIAEIKDAVKTMRQQKANQNKPPKQSYRQKSFRHLQVDYSDDEDDNAKKTKPSPSPPPRRGLTRGGLVTGPTPTNSIGAEERDAMKQFRRRGRPGRAISMEDAIESGGQQPMRRMRRVKSGDHNHNRPFPNKKPTKSEAPPASPKRALSPPPPTPQKTTETTTDNTTNTTKPSTPVPNAPKDLDTDTDNDDEKNDDAASTDSDGMVRAPSFKKPVRQGSDQSLDSKNSDS